MNEQLRSVMASVLNVSETQLSGTTTQEDIDAWDSLAVINLAVALEAEFDVALSAEEVESLISVRKIQTILEQHGVKRI